MNKLTIFAVVLALTSRCCSQEVRGNLSPSSGSGSDNNNASPSPKPAPWSDGPLGLDGVAPLPNDEPASPVEHKPRAPIKPVNLDDILNIPGVADLAEDIRQLEEDYERLSKLGRLDELVIPDSLVKPARSDKHGDAPEASAAASESPAESSWGLRRLFGGVHSWVCHVVGCDELTAGMVDLEPLVDKLMKSHAEADEDIIMLTVMVRKISESDRFAVLFLRTGVVLTCLSAVLWVVMEKVFSWEAADMAKEARKAQMQRTWDLLLLKSQHRAELRRLRELKAARDAGTKTN
eukprot:m51a1_g13703 hypothetical protein (292) ;mRNA; r:72372-73342